MTGHLSVSELDRDEDFGTIRKRVVLPGGFAFETPSRSITHSPSNLPIAVNEIPRQVNESTIDSLERGTSSLIRDIHSAYLPGPLNLAVFDLKFNSVPSRTGALSTLAHNLYSASDRVVMLPTVRTSLFKDPPRYQRFSDRRIDIYLQMMSQLIDEIETLGNHKVIMGTIPLMPPKFSRKILNAYFSKGIEAFAIDASTKDILSNEPDFRLILAEINRFKPLSNVFVYSCNLGYPQFARQRTRADDFLSIFAYVDVLGGTFKSRGGPMTIRPPNRAKVFSREEYSYQISTYQEASRKLGFNASPRQIRRHNQELQLREADHVRGLVGGEPVKRYVQGKAAVDTLAIQRLESIAKGVPPL